MDSLQSCGQGQSSIMLDGEVPSNWHQQGAVITLGLGGEGWAQVLEPRESSSMDEHILKGWKLMMAQLGSYLKDITLTWWGWEQVQQRPGFEVWYKWAL